MRADINSCLTLSDPQTLIQASLLVCALCILGMPHNDKFITRSSFLITEKGVAATRQHLVQFKQPAAGKDF